MSASDGGTGRRLEPRRPLVVIPALNEERSLPAVLRELREHHPEADVLVIDDGSHDRTAAAARAAGAPALRLPFNLGVGGAMRTGYRYAVRPAMTRSCRWTPTGSTTRASAACSPG